MRRTRQGEWVTVRVTAAAVAALACALAQAPPALAARCSDYPDQASAQRAADTRDADGDGIYCEALPCPCLKPGAGSGTPSRPATPPAPAKRGLGTPVEVTPHTRRAPCHLRGNLPDRACSPGAYYPKATRSRICTPGYARSVRNVSQAVKDRVFAAYGITVHSGATYEVDHIIPLEAGGANTLSNLYPEPAGEGGAVGFHEKDRLEDEVHYRVCSGKERLRPLQRAIATDWVKLYLRLMG